MTPELTQLHEDPPAPPVDETRLSLHRAAMRAATCFVAAAGAVAAFQAADVTYYDGRHALQLTVWMVIIESLALGLMAGVAAALLVAAEQASPRLPWQWRPPLLLGAGVLAPTASLFAISWIATMVTSGADLAMHQLDRLVRGDAVEHLPPVMPHFVVPMLFLGVARLGPLRDRSPTWRAAWGALAGAVGGVCGVHLHDLLWPVQFIGNTVLLDGCPKPVTEMAVSWALVGAALGLGERLERRIAARLAAPVG